MIGVMLPALVHGGGLGLGLGLFLLLSGESDEERHEGKRGREQGRR